MRIYHQTVRETAAVIIADGFKDGEEMYVSDFAWCGVWVFDRPFCPDGASGDTVLTLEIPDHVFAQYEWVPEGATHRGSLIPAAVLNRYGRPVPVDRAGVPASSTPAAPQTSSDTPMPIAAPSTTSAA